MSVIRIATHCTEADVSEQHFGLAREMGFETVGFLMMAHTVAGGAGQAGPDHGRQRMPVRLRGRFGRRHVLEDASTRVEALVAEIGDDTQVGFHGHENLSLSVANTILAVRAGAVQVDGSTRRFGAGAGNTSVEAMAAVFERLGIRTGIDVLTIIDAAEDVVRPLMDEECALDRLSLIMGYAGVYSSFLKHAYRAADRYGVSGAEILLECGRQRLVGGQEDQIIQIAAAIGPLRWVGQRPGSPPDSWRREGPENPHRRCLFGRREGNRALVRRRQEAGWRSLGAAQILAQVADLAATPMVTIAGDAREADACRRIVDEAVAELGGLDVVLYTPADLRLLYIEEATAEDWRASWETNVVAPALIAAAALPALRRIGGPHVLRLL